MENKSQIKKICFIATRLFQGGFSSSMQSMTSVLVNGGIKVDLLLLDPETSELPASILSGVELIDIKDYVKRDKNTIDYRSLLDLLHIHVLNRRKEKEKKDIVSLVQLRLERKALSMPLVDLSGYDAVISWEELTCNYFLAYRVIAKKKIGYVHPDYVKSRFNKSLDNNTFRKLDYIVSVSIATNNTMKRVFPQLRSRLLYIPNVVDVEGIRKKADVNTITFKRSNFDIVTVCRISIYHKGLDRLVKVVSCLEKTTDNFEWYVIGEGEERTQLEFLVEQAGVKHLHLLGGKDNPLPFVKRADLFALLSNYEGKPVAVEEAKALGIPVLVTNYSSAKEQVSASEGIIVSNDPVKIANCIRRLMDNKKCLEKSQTTTPEIKSISGAEKLLDVIYNPEFGED